MPEAIRFVLATLVIIAAASDLKSRRIPNWLTFSGLVAGFALRAVISGWAGVLEGALGAAAAFALYFALFALRAMGGGDVKLMTAVGALAGPQNWLYIFLLASICGGIATVFILLKRGTLLRTLFRVGIIVGELASMRAPYHALPEVDIAHPRAVTLPHGVSIAVGSLLFLACAP